MVLIKEHKKQDVEFIYLTLPNGGWTDDQFFEFCQLNDNLKIERLATGEIIIMGLTGGETGINNSELIIELGIWNRIKKRGKVFDSSTGFKLPNGATYSPDVAWIPIERWNALDKKQRKKFVPFAPDFLCELLSNTNQRSLVQSKMEEFMENGSRLGWLVDPFKKLTLVYRPSIEVIAIPFDQAIYGGQVLEGLKILMAEIME